LGSNRYRRSLYGPITKDEMMFKPKLFSSLVASAVLLATGVAASAQPLQRDPVQNVVQLSASGTVEVQQDLLSISMTTTRDGADATVVQGQLKQALEAALIQARQAAVPGQLDIRTGNFSLYPRYGKDGKINGWQGSTELVLEGKDFSRITAVAGKIQALTLGSINFMLSREQRARVEGEAQAQGIERFNAKAAEISRSFGFRDFTLREISISSNEQFPGPRPRMMAMQSKAEMAEAPVPVEPGKSSVVVNVSGSVQMR
jgi:predicted secreted protein